MKDLLFKFENLVGSSIVQDLVSQSVAAPVHSLKMFRRQKA
jgi:hypothetical protein